jgi:hypothetical protein
MITGGNRLARNMEKKEGKKGLPDILRRVSAPE